MTSLAVLLTLADSRLPTGAHVHSGGIEEAIAAGMVTGLATLEAFLKRRVRTHGNASTQHQHRNHCGYVQSGE